MRRHAGHALEHAEKMIRAQLRRLRQRLERQSGVGVALDRPHGPRHACNGVARRLPGLSRDARPPTCSASAATWTLSSSHDRPIDSGKAGARELRRPATAHAPEGAEAHRTLTSSQRLRHRPQGARSAREHTETRCSGRPHRAHVRTRMLTGVPEQQRPRRHQLRSGTAARIGPVLKTACHDDGDSTRSNAALRMDGRAGRTCRRRLPRSSRRLAPGAVPLSGPGCHAGRVAPVPARPRPQLLPRNRLPCRRTTILARQEPIGMER